MNVNKLILGDNLDIMKSMDGESVDLVYLDPPFFSNRNYEVIWGDAGEIRSFQDRWAGGIDHYIAWLKERVEQMHRLLKPTGSIFLHCDWHADAYIRVQILDRIFGEKNFRNEIIWHYRRWTGKSKCFQKLHDTVFFYTKSDKYTFNEMYTDYTEGSIDRKKQGVLRRFKKGCEPVLVSDSEVDDKGVRENDVWQIPFVAPSAKERIGYPTQKPEALLERIIRCASNKGDVVLDPFIGGGTTAAVAEKQFRKWIGIDQSAMAVKVTDLRLQRQADFFSVPYTLELHKYDYDTLRHQDAFEFESWIIGKFGGVPQNKKGGDRGVDGKMPDGTPIQVKRSDNIGLQAIFNFQSAIRGYDKNLFAKNVKAGKPAGYIIAFDFGKGAVNEVAKLKNSENIIIKLVKVEDIVPLAHRPTIKLDINELERNEKGSRQIEFTARGDSAAGIEFYSWDFEFNEEKGFKPSVIIDKEGKQTITVKTGTHNIAVKAIDNDGIENIEVVQLKVNGAVERM